MESIAASATRKKEIKKERKKESFRVARLFFCLNAAVVGVKMYIAYERVPSVRMTEAQSAVQITKHQPADFEREREREREVETRRPNRV